MWTAVTSCLPLCCSYSLDRLVSASTSHVEAAAEFCFVTDQVWLTLGVLEPNRWCHGDTGWMDKCYAAFSFNLLVTVRCFRSKCFIAVLLLFYLELAVAVAQLAVLFTAEQLIIQSWFIKTLQTVWVVITGAILLRCFISEHLEEDFTVNMNTELTCSCR